MSKVFYLDDVAHWISHYTQDKQPEELRSVVAHTYCHLVRCFQRGNALMYEGAPTCFVCIVKHDLFRNAEKTMRDAGGLERFHKLVYGDHGIPA